MIAIIYVLLIAENVISNSVAYGWGGGLGAVFSAYCGFFLCIALETNGDF